jgi:hypothetical protein
MSDVRRSRIELTMASVASETHGVFMKICSREATLAIPVMMMTMHSPVERITLTTVKASNVWRVTVRSVKN